MEFIYLVFQAIDVLKLWNFPFPAVPHLPFPTHPLLSTLFRYKPNSFARAEYFKPQIKNLLAEFSVNFKFAAKPFSASVAQLFHLGIVQSE